jgi:RNA recognition motif-containing protein
LKKPAVVTTPAPGAKADSKASTPAKTETKQGNKAGAGEKSLNKTQLFINSIKESVSVSELKSLYPKAKSVKMQKRKVGPNKKFVQFAFVTFENESDAAEALKSVSQIGGEKVNVSFAFAQSGKKVEEKSEEKSEKSEKPAKQQAKKTEAKKDKTPVEKELSTNVIYVGQLPEHAAEDDVKKLFPKSTKIDLIAAKASNKGVRPGFAFVTFADDVSAAAAIKLGPTLTLKGSQLKVAYQTKRTTPTKSE